MSTIIDGFFLAEKFFQITKQLDKLIQRITLLEKGQVIMMTQTEEMKAVLQNVKDATSNLAIRVEAAIAGLKAQLDAEDLEDNEFITELTNVAATLNQISPADSVVVVPSPDEPVPTPAPPVPVESNESTLL